MSLEAVFQNLCDLPLVRVQPGWAVTSFGTAWSAFGMEQASVWRDKVFWDP